MNILHIDASPRPVSHSRQLSAGIIEKILKVVPDARITRRDLGAAPIPHATADYATTLSSPATLAAPIEGSLDLAEPFIEEVDGADILVIGTPMHNFTVPSVLKAWIDQVIRAGRTFVSTPKGKVGLLRDRPVFVGIASGGTFTHEHSTQVDFLRPYLTAALDCIGLKTVQFLTVEATAFLEGEKAGIARDKALEPIDLTVISLVLSPERA